MLKIIHGLWYYTIIEGGTASYFDLLSSAIASAENRGYELARIEALDGQTVEIWRKKIAIFLHSDFEGIIIDETNNKGENNGTNNAR